MKRIHTRRLSLLLVLCILVSSLPFSASAAATGRTTAYVNLRTGAGTSYSILETVPRGATLTVTDTSGSWYRVTAPSGQSGYMSAQYIQITGNTTPSTDSGTRWSAQTTTYVHLRRGAGTGFASLGVVPTGASITVLEKTTASWYKVQRGTQVGYMYAQYIRILSVISSATPAPATPKPTAAPSTSTPTATAAATATAKPTTAPTVTTRTGKTTTYVNLRSGASTSSRVLLTVPTNGALTVLDTSNSSWYRVTYNGTTGYMFAQYIRLNSTATATPKPSIGGGIGTARTTAVLNLRTGPSTGYRSLGLLAYNAPLTVLEKVSNGWYRVRNAAGTEGYCSGSYLKITLGTVAATATPKPTVAPTATVAPTVTPSPTPVPTEVVAKGKTNAFLNLRRGPSTSTSILTTIPKDGEFEVLDMEDDTWYYVRYGTRTGYLNTAYLTLTEFFVATPTPSPTPIPSEELTVESTSTMKIVQAFVEKNGCYISNKRIRVEGLMLHSIGAANPSAASLVEQYNVRRPSGREVCVHGFLQADGTVYQTLPWNMRGWHAGGAANSTHIGIEMCEPASIVYTGGATLYATNKNAAIAYVRGTYQTAVELFAELCAAYDLNPLEKGVIISHSEGNAAGIASAHSDPEHLWRALGLSYTMDTFRRDVAKHLEKIK